VVGGEADKSMSEVVKRPRGRPPSRELPFSQEIAESICQRLANGESLLAICENEGYPTRDTVRKWADIDPDFHMQYVRAREAQAEHYVDEMTLIADDGRNDFMEKQRQNGETFVDVNREHLDRSKIRIATRQWIIERVLANKYGPKPQVVVQNNQQNVVSLDPVEAAQIYQKTITGG
jgi:hypothetical protein